MKKFFSIFFLVLTCLGYATQDIVGFWKTVNEDGIAQSIIAIYDYEGLRYGRIIATFGDNGQIDDSIYKPVKRAQGLSGEPFYSGLDIIWDLQDAGSSYMGTIMDPEHGKTYNAELWVKNDALKVKGSLFIFSRTQTWYKVVKEDLPKGFKLPNIKKFVPDILAKGYKPLKPKKDPLLETAAQ